MALRGEILVALEAARLTALVRRVTRLTITATFAVAVAAVFDRWIAGCGGVVEKSG